METRTILLSNREYPWAICNIDMAIDPEIIALVIENGDRIINIMGPIMSFKISDDIRNKIKEILNTKHPLTKDLIVPIEFKVDKVEIGKDFNITYEKFGWEERINYVYQKEIFRIDEYDPKVEEGIKSIIKARRK